MKKCLLLAIGFFMFFAFSFSAYAQQKIAYVDLQLVLSESKPAKADMALLRKEEEAKKTVIEQKTKALEDMRQDLIQNGEMMSGSKRRNLAEIIEKKQKDLNRTIEDMRLELRRKQLELEQNFIIEIQAIAKKIGKQEGFDIIFSKTGAGILYVNPSSDITQKVISAYDASR
ncbi:MAG: OmpH family outer membrane protein [Candidatus Dadabacteria bacterium]|nr:OmpH family outer membrane protein [Candidatus Dadabacteria bacterium]